jgi:hypothetical protein
MAGNKCCAIICCLFLQPEHSRPLTGWRVHIVRRFKDLGGKKKKKQKEKKPWPYRTNQY